MFNKLLDAMNLGDEDDDDYVDEVPAFPKKQEKAYNDSPRSVQEKAKPVKMTSRPKNKGAAGPMEIVSIKPTSFDDAREIAETLLADRAVILNMDGLDLGVAQRIIDFICGACFAIEGNLQKVSTYIFIITPPGVELSGDVQNIVDAFDFSGLKTSF